MNDISAIKSRLAASATALALPEAIRILAASKGHRINAYDMSVAIGASDRVQQILKAAVTSLGSAALPELVGAGGAFATYAQTLASQGAFFAAMANGNFLRVPFQQRVNFDAGLAVGAVVGEGEPVPVSSLSLDTLRLEPLKASTILVLANELWRDASPEGQALVNQLLRDAITKTVDTSFLASLGTPTTFAADPDVTLSILGALRQALTEVRKASSYAGMFWVADRAASDILATTDSDKVDPYGTGRVVGLPVYVSDAAALGTLTLVDGRSIAANLGELGFAASEAAALQMLDNPTNDSVDTVATNMVSMFQTHSTAVKCTVAFAAEAFRASPAAIVDFGVSA